MRYILWPTVYILHVHSTADNNLQFSVFTFRGLSTQCILIIMLL